MLKLIKNVYFCVPLYDDFDISKNYILRTFSDLEYGFMCKCIRKTIHSQPSLTGIYEYISCSCSIIHTTNVISEQIFHDFGVQNKYLRLFS